MRTIFVGVLLAIFGPIATHYLEGYMSAAPEWVHRLLQFACVGAGVLIVVLSDPIWSRLKLPHQNAVFSTITVSFIAATIAGTGWWLFVVPFRADPPLIEIAAPTKTPEPLTAGPVQLSVSLTPQSGYTFTPQGGEVINAQFLHDRRQYLLLFQNKTIATMVSIDLLVQMPYPIENHELTSERAVEVVFKPRGTQMTVLPSGGGSATVTRRPISKYYELKIATLQPSGFVKILLLLNSWRDPRGKTVPANEAMRYFVPDVGPKITFIDGPFRYRVGDDTIMRRFYANLELSQDKAVSLGNAEPPPPETLLIGTGWQ